MSQSLLVALEEDPVLTLQDEGNRVKQLVLAKPRLSETTLRQEYIEKYQMEMSSAKLSRLLYSLAAEGVLELERELGQHHGTAESPNAAGSKSRCPVAGRYFHRVRLQSRERLDPRRTQGRPRDPSGTDPGPGDSSSHQGRRLLLFGRHSS